MNSDDPRRPSSNERRDAILSHLYGELDGGEASRFRRELARDPALRAEWEALDGARGSLDAWPPLADDADPAALAAEIAASRPRSAASRSGNARGGRARRRAAPLFVGLAAALVGFVALFALGTEVSREGDRLTLSIVLPWVEADARPDRVADLERRVLEVAQHQDSTTRRLADWSRLEEDKRRLLVQALDRALTDQRQATTAWMNALTRGAAREDRRTREAIVGLASYVTQETPKEPR